MEKFLQALAALLPTGYAWPRDPDSVLMRVLRGLAGVFFEHHGYTAETVRQWQPLTTVNRLVEWEEACGLPDKCFGDDQPEALRRKLLLMRLRGAVLPYTDSSPAAPGAIEQLCLRLGYVATVRYNTPFRCGVNRTADRLGALDGQLYITVTTGNPVFRVAQNRVADRLVNGTSTGNELACYLKRVLPARYALNIIFI